MQVNYFYLAFVLLLSIILLITGRFMVVQGYTYDQMTVERVDVETARPKILMGESLFICAYEGVEKYRAVALEGSISIESFREVSSLIPKDRSLIFYCA
jgi:hypothetical protein